MIWGQLLIKALVSGAVIAVASETARRNPGLGGLIASLPLVSVLALVWLWRDSGDLVRVADMAMGSVSYVTASLPAFILLAWLLRRGAGFPLALLAAAVVGYAGYLAAGWLGGRMGWPV